jgi:3-oxoacyl-[acyl-carrier protein] reductase/meso-butanediol dehydrogenase/(S,S)-butanediol dehydrogenase/diacetyl reductase
MTSTKQSKVVVITGGSQGIGAAIAETFCNAGICVVIGSRRDNGLAKKLGKKARYCAMDACKQSDHRKAVELALDWKGHLDAYINCAGFSAWRPIDQIDETFLTEILDTNLKGVFWGCKAAVSALEPGGVIVNISSLAGKRGSANNSAYCASKFGVTGLTQALAKELGPKGIRVNAVCPVYVKTSGVLHALENPDSPAQGKKVAEYLHDFTKSQTALGRLPEGKDVAQMCLFLISAQASAITGQSINVDCGVLPQ